jgi:hypothetical protein
MLQCGRDAAFPGIGGMGPETGGLTERKIHFDILNKLMHYEQMP